MIGLVAAWAGLGLLALLALVLFAPMHLVSKNSPGVASRTYIRWLFFRFALSEEAFQTRKRRLDAWRKKHPSPKKPQGEKKQKKPQATLSPESFGEKLATIVRLLEAAKTPLGKLVRSFRFYRVELTIVVAGEDAAATGMLYGQVNWALSSAYGLAKTFLSLAEPKIDVRPDFCGGQGKISWDIRGRLRLIRVLQGALGLLIGYLRKMKETGEKVSR